MCIQSDYRPPAEIYKAPPGSDGRSGFISENTAKPTKARDSHQDTVSYNIESDSEYHKSSAAYESRGGCTVGIMRGDGATRDVPKFQHMGMTPYLDKVPAKMDLADEEDVCEAKTRCMDSIPAKMRVLAGDYSAFGTKEKDASSVLECMTDRQDVANRCFDADDSGMYVHVHTQTVPYIYIYTHTHTHTHIQTNKTHHMQVRSKA